MANETENTTTATEKKTRSTEPSIYTQAKHTLVALVKDIDAKRKEFAPFISKLDSGIWEEAKRIVETIGDGTRSSKPLAERLKEVKAAINEHWAKMPLTPNGTPMPPTAPESIEWQNESNKLINKRDRLQREFDAEKKAAKEKQAETKTA